MPKEDAPSIWDQDSSYRRGTVLGLTVAEVFILLLFLLMLVFLALAQEWQTETDRPSTEPKKELEKAKSVLNGVRQVVEEYKGSIPVPDRPVTLERGQGKVMPVSKDPPDESEDSLPEDVRKLLERATGAIQEAQRKTREAKKRSQRAEAARDKAQQAAVRAAKDLDVLREKGHNPPCWYERVPDGRGGDREKPYYTFDVAVFDDNMILRRVQTPPDRATDDGGSSYAEEAEKLLLDQLPYGTPLDDAAIVENLRPVHDAGKEGKVRSYSCIFWARVWDETSPGAKERWKSAHDGILESLLGTYTVSDDPWQE